jgi:hypothetical protein
MDTFVPGTPAVYLTIRHGPRSGHTFSAAGPSVTIGRIAGNSIVIDDPQVSRHHASLTLEAGQWVLRDLGSTNGTAVNGQRIASPWVVREGDVIGLGDVVLGVQTGGGPGAGDSTVAGMQVQAPVAVRPLPEPVAVPQPGGAAQAGRSWVLPIVVSILAVGMMVMAVLLGLSLLAKPTTPPQVVVNSPPSGFGVSAGGEVEVQCTITDPDGVARVELWADNTLVASQSAPDARGQSPFVSILRWTSSAPGPHVLVVKAYDAGRQESQSAPILVNVGEGEGGAATSTPPSPTPIPPLDTATPTSSPTPTPTHTPTPTSTDTPTPTHTPTPIPTSTSTTTPTAVPTDTPPLPTGTLTPVLSPTPCVDDARFVADITVPDGTIVGPAQRVDKVWRLSNTGTCQWSAGYAATFVSGSQIPGPTTAGVPETAPGGTADVGVTLYAPVAPDTYAAYWQMRDAAGVTFGQLFKVEIVVPAPATVTPIPTSTAILLPTPEASISFSADRTEIAAGECTTLRWDVENVAAVYLDGAGVVGHGTQSACPDTTTTYVLHIVRRDGGTTERSVTISVTGDSTFDSPVEELEQ